MKYTATADRVRREVFCECRNDTYRKWLGEKYEPIWVCLNCNKVTPRRTRSKASNPN